MNITNEDNMELMSRYEDKHFDLAIVDPPYGLGISNYDTLGNKNMYLNDIQKINKDD